MNTTYSNNNTYYNNDRQRNKVVITPWLLLRYATTDLGLRPIPGGTPFWASPDISVESSDPLGNAVAGEQNFVHATIYNLGAADAAPVQVDFYWADPSLGLGPANLNLIGTEWVEVERLRSKPVRCNTPWIPQFLNDGHECLIVNCSNWILDPIIHPSEPVLDRHCGQRNIHVDEVRPGQPIKFNINISNIFSFPLANHISATSDRFLINSPEGQILTRELVNHAVFFHSGSNTALELKDRMKAGTRQYGTAQKLRKIMMDRRLKQPDAIPITAAGTALNSPRIQSSLSEKSTYAFNANAEKNFGERLIGNSLLSGKNAGCRADAFTLHNVLLQPFEQRQVQGEITIPADAKPGEIITVNFAQDIGNLTLGGYTYAFLIRR
jgi:hypothetical protein